jgi:transposase
MMHEPTALEGSALVQGLLQFIEHEAGMGGPRRPPPDDAPGEGVDHEGHVDKADPGRDIGEVADP